MQFHGYTGSCGDWQDKLQFAALGYSVVSMDVRGQGGQSQDTGNVLGNTHHGHIIRGLDDKPDNLFFRQVFLDTAQLTSIVMELPEVDETRVAAAGGSQGGALALACAALEPGWPESPPTFLFYAITSGFGKWTWPKTLMRSCALISDYSILSISRKMAFFTRLGYIDIQYLAPRIRAEVLAGVGLMDTVCPPSSQFAALNKISSPLQLEIYPDFAHENLPGMQDKVYQFFNGIVG